jgi:hypothetical protein
MSGLIAVGIVRAAAAKAAAVANQTVDGFEPWKEYLQLVLRQERGSFKTEFDFVIADYGFPFSRDDILEFCERYILFFSI